MHDLVDVIRRHPRLDLSRRKVQHFPRQPADLAHALLLFLGEDLDLIPAYELLQPRQDPIFTSLHSPPPCDPP